jgi:hypothetical protein
MEKLPLKVRGAGTIFNKTGWDKGSKTTELSQCSHGLGCSVAAWLTSTTAWLLGEEAVSLHPELILCTSFAPHSDKCYCIMGAITSGLLLNENLALLSMPLYKA